MKYKDTDPAGGVDESLPPRGAWIEISLDVPKHTVHECRSPHGERGLKFAPLVTLPHLRQSLPPRGAWIEISSSYKPPPPRKSLPPRGAWIEICYDIGTKQNTTRRSPHGERGLKLRYFAQTFTLPGRSPHGERGLKFFGHSRISVRSCRSPHGERGLKSAPIPHPDTYGWSLPPRGAWIEIALYRRRSRQGWSLPPRGAWIEILSDFQILSKVGCRSPHGERGLKLWKTCAPEQTEKSLPPRGAWIEML